MSLVKVWTEVDDGKCQSLPAKIVVKKGNVLVIKYISPTDKRDTRGRRIFEYEDDTYEVTDDSITEYLNSNTELDLGFEEISTGRFVKCDSDDDSDEDYVPSSSEEDSDSDSDEEEDSEDDDDDFVDDDDFEDDDEE